MACNTWRCDPPSDAADLVRRHGYSSCGNSVATFRVITSSEGVVTGKRGAVSGITSAVNLSKGGGEATRQTALQPGRGVDVHVGPFEPHGHVIPDEGVARSDATDPMPNPLSPAARPTRPPLIHSITLHVPQSFRDVLIRCVYMGGHFTGGRREAGEAMNLWELFPSICGYERIGDQVRLYVDGPKPQPNFTRRRGVRTAVFRLYASGR
jgi:hypothetical protein